MNRAAWARPGTHPVGETIAVVVAVLRAAGGSMPRNEARLAATLCLEPALLGPFLSRSDYRAWITRTGDDPKPDGRSWGAALSGMRGRGQLVDDIAGNRWALGPAAGAILTEGWPDERARFVLKTLPRALAAFTKEEGR